MPQIFPPLPAKCIMRSMHEIDTLQPDVTVVVSVRELRQYISNAIERNRPKVPDGLVQELLDMQIFLNSHDADIVYRAINFLKSLQGDDHQPHR